MSLERLTKGLERHCVCYLALAMTTNNPMLDPRTIDRQATPGYKLVSDAELMEFGFIQSDFSSTHQCA
jgi:hypothetical protein